MNQVGTFMATKKASPMKCPQVFKVITETVESLFPLCVDNAMREAWEKYDYVDVRFSTAAHSTGLGFGSTIYTAVILGAMKA